MNSVPQELNAARPGTRSGVLNRTSTPNALRSGPSSAARQRALVHIPCALGIARAALEFACEYAAEREAFGGPILEKQGISFPLPT
jgi:Acyl-CoA dehydrogenase, C-terminal domain